MSGVLERTLGILELLSQHGDGLELAAIATQLNLPKSAAHRLLADLGRCGYVRQPREQGPYRLTTKLVSLGLGYLAQTGIVDMAQPLLDNLAQQCGELVRLSVIDGDELTWVARAQGARQGLRYDPDMGGVARLSCSAAGIAWMSCLSDEAAAALALAQGLGSPKDFGPRAPATIQAMLTLVAQARRDGYSLMEDTYAAGLSAVAVPVRQGQDVVLGIVSIAGPSVRVTTERMRQWVPDLVATANQLATLGAAWPQRRASSAYTSRPQQPIYAP